MGVNLRKFAHGGSEIRRVHSCGEFKGCLGFHSQEPAPRQNSQQFAVKPRRKLWIALCRSRAPQLQEQTDPANQFREQIESQRYEECHEKYRQQKTYGTMLVLAGFHPLSAGTLFHPEPVASRFAPTLGGALQI